MLNSCLVALADQGFTPTSIAARLTWLSAPDAIQGALAAGLLGGGSRFLGVSEDTGRFLDETIARVEDALPTDDAGWDQLAREAITRHRRTGAFIPGLGHHLHNASDPRVSRLLELAHEHGTFGPRRALFSAIGRVASEMTRKDLPLTGPGACGAGLADSGIPPPMPRGVALLSRCAVRLGQLAGRRGTRPAVQVLPPIR